MMIRRFTIVLTSLWIWLSWLQASEVIYSEDLDEKGSVQFKMEGHFSGPGQYGYYPVRVSLVNHRDSPVTIELRYENSEKAYSYHYEGNSKLKHYLTLQAGGHQTYQRDLLLPLVPSKKGGSRMDFTVVLGGYTSTDSVQHFSSKEFQSVLMSVDLYNEYGSKLDAGLGGARTRYGADANFASVFDVALMPKQWQAYQGFEKVIISDKEWMKVPAEEKNAILHWVRLGGYLQVLCLNASSDRYSLQLPRDLFPLTKENDLRATYSATAAQIYTPARHMAYRNVHDPTAEDAQVSWGLSTGIIQLKKGEPEPKTLLEETKVFNNKSVSFKGGENDFRLVEEFGVEEFGTTLLVWMLVVFALVVGPINFFWLARAGRRHRLLMTIPIITIAASLLLVALILVEDGTGGKGHRVCHVEIMHEGSEHYAYIQQRQLLKSGLLLSSSFEMTDQAVLHPVELSEYNQWNRVHEDSSENYSQSLNGSTCEYHGDWFQSRAQMAHAIEAVQPQRGKLSLKKNSNVQLESTFDFPISTVFYYDEDAQWWRGAALTRGGTCSLQKCEATVLTEVLKEITLDEYTMNRIKVLAQRKGHFLALTKKYPMLDSLPSIDWTNHTSILTGKLH